jgi:hypothetical protein
MFGHITSVRAGTLKRVKHSSFTKVHVSLVFINFHSSQASISTFESVLQSSHEAPSDHRP